MSQKHALMAVFAHPDDEAFGTGGTLAKYAAEGCDVFLVTATRGEAGGISLPELATADTLAAVREAELCSACQTYGIHPPIFLDYLDGRLTVVHQGEAVGRLVRVVRRLKPQVLITFGPDGIYGHYDHLAVHRWATAAYDLAADPTFAVEPEGGEPHQVDKLYYRVTAQEAIEARVAAGQRATVPMDGVPFPFVGYPMRDITTVIDIGNYVEAKRQGILCHVTQVGRENRFSQEIEAVRSDPWFREETYILARSTVGRPQGLETDLLAGLR